MLIVEKIRSKNNEKRNPTRDYHMISSSPTGGLEDNGESFFTSKKKSKASKVTSLK